MIDIVSITFGLSGVVFGLRCYMELWRWAKQCQNAKIAIAHKQRVQLHAPLTEWLGWANQLAKDETSKGRVIYRNGHVSVSILRPESKKPIRKAIRRVRRERSEQVAA